MSNPGREREKSLCVVPRISFGRPNIVHPLKRRWLLFVVRIRAGDREDGFAARKLRIVAGASFVAVVKLDAERLRKAMANLGGGVCHCLSRRGEAGQDLWWVRKVAMLRYLSIQGKAIMVDADGGNTPSSAKIALGVPHSVLLLPDLAGRQAQKLRQPMAA